MGSWLRRRNPSAEDEQHEDLGIILGATLTLLALIIGFSISMASSRYDQRKNLEEAEAKAIGTEMLRADLLHRPMLRISAAFLARTSTSASSSTSIRTLRQFS
jgi:hypothetical protein